MQGFEAKAITYRRRCTKCGVRFKIKSSVGPSLICDDCANVLLGIIWGGTVTGRDKFGNVEVTNVHNPALPQARASAQGCTQ